MSGAFRTPTGGLIDRTRPLRFTFDGRAFTGLPGDTLASALLANGVHLVGRSFKYHRPRGILAAGAEEPNALVTLDQGQGRVTPNLRATQIDLYDGLIANSQNRFPSLAFDLGSIAGLASPLIGAGFYYKTFIGPRAFGLKLWSRLFEPAIRRAAGLGRPPVAADPDSYAEFHDHCDVLVVGAGPAGLAAALAAGRTGARVLICDEHSAPGGSLLSETAATIDGAPAALWLAEALAELATLANVTLRPRTQAFGAFLQTFYALAERCGTGSGGPRERLWQVRARRVVLATGAIERPLVFAGNDRPGILLADAARAYVNRYGVLPGRRIVVVTSHDSAYRAALDLHAAGAEIALIADMRGEARGALPEAARAAGIAVREGATVTGTRGRQRIAQAGIATAGPDDPRDENWLACDALLMSGGWTPSVHLHSQARGTLAFDAGLDAFVPDRAPPDTQSIGAAAGAFGLQAALDGGFAAGAAAALATGFRTDPVQDVPVAADPPMTGCNPGVLAGPARSGKAFVDFQNDVTVRDITQAVSEGMQSIEHVKRYTTTGMATDQGKTSNLNALTIAARALGRSVPQVGLTTFRQPYTPVTFGTLAGGARGALFDPVRQTPARAGAEALGAVFENNGQWKRALWFGANGADMASAVTREVTLTRAVAGLFDASTLGKIEVAGPDAATFLDRIYATPLVKLTPGRCRYALMLTEAGFVMDDGIVARLNPDRFHVTTTTGGAARVLAHMEDYLQTEFPDLCCWLTSVTEQWAVFAVQGPQARRIVAPLVEGVDLADGAMPHMSVAEGLFAGVPARIFRVSFTGEAGYEINVPADFGAAVWKLLLERIQALGGVAYGTEAMHVMRAEKGYIIVGQDTDGTVTPDDLDMGRLVSRAKHDFIGKRSLRRADMLKPDRKQLVGLLTDDPAALLDEGAQITATRAPSAGTHALGHVTSSYSSPALRRSIALALIEGGRSRIGETVWSSTGTMTASSLTMPCRIVAPVFLDPEGARLHG